ncbi:metalloregulator ArsR/SmtB family transcription factor [Kitasatospora cineracea]|uniref:ArsR/SmtB family transcription factor n=1 Tax=Kitasatospora cineracea TaxID=88074 RepID=UPI003414D0FF
METQGKAWDEDAAERVVSVLKAVADPSRYRLLWALSGGRELPVSALAELLGAHVAATSQHLARLRAAGLVLARREGTRIYYRAAEVRDLLEEAARTVHRLPGPGDDGGPGPGPDAVPDTAAQRARAGLLRRRPATGQAG